MIQIHRLKLLELLKFSSLQNGNLFRTSSQLSINNGYTGSSLPSLYNCSTAGFSTLGFKDHPILDSSKFSHPMLYQSRSYAMKQELKEYGLLWKKPEDLRSWHPKKSGDLKPFEEVDTSKPITDLLCIEKEIEKSDKRTQDLLSVAFGNKKEILKKARYLMVRKIQRHAFDFDSPEVRVALMTVDIRFYQKLIFVDGRKRRKLKTTTRVCLKEKVEKRRKMLSYIQKTDYKCFEWLIEQLDILVRPIVLSPKRVSRKDSLIKLVDLHCSKIVAAKLDAYRLHLESLKGPFLKEKQETLKWIVETEKRLGVPVSVDVPFDEEFIDLPTLDVFSEVTENKLKSETKTEL